jgi:hypothetical protein
MVRLAKIIVLTVAAAAMVGSTIYFVQVTRRLGGPSGLYDQFRYTIDHEGMGLAWAVHAGLALVAAVFLAVVLRWRSK